MKQDVLDALSGRHPHKIPSKETLHHPGIIKHVAGFEVWDDTPRAFEIAYRKLGIDIHGPLPTENAKRPKVPDGTWVEDGYRYSDYGVYPTKMPVEHAVGTPKVDDTWVFGYDTARDDFDLQSAIRDLRATSAAFAADFCDLAVFYHLYYTTLFMWPVVTFDWAPFMLAAATDPVRFDELLWQPWARISRKHFQVLASLDDPVVFCHDDLCMGQGPVFPPAFYDRYIFPRYEWIMEPAVTAGKKIVFVSDGNIDTFLERLLEFPIAGIMFENPTTPYERVLQTWGKAGRGFIGGVSPVVLTFGTPDEVAAHTREAMLRGREYPGFIVASVGQLPGNIPMANMLAYFRTRNELGCQAEV